MSKQLKFFSQVSRVTNIHKITWAVRGWKENDKTFMNAANFHPNARKCKYHAWL